MLRNKLGKYKKPYLQNPQRVAGKYFSPADFLFLPLFIAAIYGVVSIGQEWRSEFNPITTIDLSGWSLPKYTILSAFRGIVAYFFSLVFTLVVGYGAARSRWGEWVILPVLDILQSIPVLGFLPGLVLGLIALFPKTNMGLELAAIIMIFTGQVWNMTFGFYGSLKSIPSDYLDTARIVGLTRYETFRKVELPFSALSLSWNSLMSMAGGWFFLTICESFSLGDYEYRLPGIGAYMSEAIKQGNQRAMGYGVLAMILLIIGFDFLLWRPVLAWAQRFRVDEVTPVSGSAPLLQWLMSESRIIPRARKNLSKVGRGFKRRLKFKRGTFGYSISKKIKVFPKKGAPAFRSPVWGVLLKISLACLGLLFLFFVFQGTGKIIALLAVLKFSSWKIVFHHTFFTFLRVMGAVAMSAVWTLPFAVWVTSQPTRLKIAQPTIQILASFPAPMLFPLALGLLLKAGMSMNFASMFLMFLGVQWYLLFNVMSGALRIPSELKSMMHSMGSSLSTRWTKLYFPSIFPSFVTGCVTAAGGAWNASIVTEYFVHHGKLLRAEGLGALISDATVKGDYPTLVAGLTVMVALVIVMNRTFWARAYYIAQNRYKLES